MIRTPVLVEETSVQILDFLKVVQLKVTRRIWTQSESVQIIPVHADTSSATRTPCTHSLYTPWLPLRSQVLLEFTYPAFSRMNNAGQHRMRAEGFEKENQHCVRKLLCHKPTRSHLVEDKIHPAHMKWKMGPAPSTKEFCLSKDQRGTKAKS